MARSLRFQEEGAAYHVLSRGNLKQDIFQGDEDKACFLKLLRRGAERYSIDVFAYCLMENHYHLSLRISTENLPEFMHFLGSSYASYLVRNGWVGHVFSGRYKSIRVEEEEYFLIVNRYIHLNPVEADIVERPEEYAWSNYDSCINDGNESWLEENWLVEYFGQGLEAARARYKEFVDEAIGVGSCYPENEVVAQALLGSEDFLGRINASIREEEWAKGVIGRRELTRIASLGQVRDAVCEHLGITGFERGDYRYDQEYRYACWLLLNAAKEYTSASNGDIAEVFGGISENAVSHRFAKIKGCLRQSSAIHTRLEADKRRVLELLEVRQT